MSNQDVALGGLMILLLIGSAFDATAKWATYLGLFLLFLVWFSTWQTKSLQSFLTALGGTLFPNAGGQYG
jgi:hypothetical protein